MTENKPTSRQCHKCFLQCSKFASERPQVRLWGRQTCFLPRAPSNLVKPLTDTIRIYHCMAPGAHNESPIRILNLLWQKEAQTCHLKHCCFFRGSCLKHVSGFSCEWKNVRDQIVGHSHLLLLCWRYFRVQALSCYWATEMWKIGIHHLVSLILRVFARS